MDLSKWWGIADTRPAHPLFKGGGDTFPNRGERTRHGDRSSDKRGVDPSRDLLFAETRLMMCQLPLRPPKVSDVRQLKGGEPWPSKCGGELRVPVSLPHTALMSLLDYDPQELAHLGRDIRGLRVFYIDGARTGGIAGNQFHRIRTEIAFVVMGAVRWEFEDLYGDTRFFHAERECAVMIPPFILHRAIFTSEGGTLATLANTIYVRDDPATHDTYSLEIFRSLQTRMRQGPDAS